MSEDLLFVSCDIIGHSAELNTDVQLERAAAINDTVRSTLSTLAPEQTFWFSGGDGGHAALEGEGAPEVAVRLLVALAEWSRQAHVPLRITGCSGPVKRFEGADGRTDMIGPGLNLAAHVLSEMGADGRIVVTDGFRARCEGVPGTSFHEARMLRDTEATPIQVWLLTQEGRFISSWTPEGVDDRKELQLATERNDVLAALYYAKRLLQVHSGDSSAIQALRTFMGSSAGQLSQRLLSRLFADPLVGQAFVRGAVLVERGKGDLLCMAGDDGSTMFLTLRGWLAGYLPSNPSIVGVPDFELGPGELVGELAFALKSSRTATLRCASDCVLLAFSQEHLLSEAIRVSPKVKETIDAIVLDRIVQNTCVTASFLSGKDRTGPLGGLEKPWIDLIPFARSIEMAWRPSELRPDAPELAAPGLYVIVAGSLESGGGAALRAQDLPVLAADFPGMFPYRPGPWRLASDVTVLFVGADGFAQFGRDVYDSFTAAVYTLV